LGATSGFGRHAQDFYEPHERPKQLWVKALVKGACQQLRALQLPTAWALVATHAPVRCTTPVRAIGSLLEEGRSLPEFRRRQALACPVAGMVALIVLATFCDVMRGQRDLAAFARKRSQAQLRALGFSCDPHTGRVRCPSETAFFRVLGALSADQVEALLLRWPAKLLGSVNALIAIDGKTLLRRQRRKPTGANIIAAAAKCGPCTRCRLNPRKSASPEPRRSGSSARGCAAADAGRKRRVI
jgi:hypothetical protein